MATNNANKPLKKGKVIAKYALNFRAKPNVDAEKLAEGPILSGEFIDIVSKRGAWYRVNYKGNSGFVMAEFIEVLEQEDK